MAAINGGPAYHAKPDKENKRDGLAEDCRVKIHSTMPLSKRTL